MNVLLNFVDRLRGLPLEKMAALRPPYPVVALAIDCGEIVLVRLKRRRGQVTLETHQVRPMPESMGSSFLRPNLGAKDDVAGQVRQLFEGTGTRPGRVSLVLPDNLAKVSLLALPERPASRRQLEEIVRFRLRRSVPFRMEDAALSYQVLPGDGKAIHVLVALVRRYVVELYERAIEAAGARPGLIDLCTPNLFNLCRAEVTAAASGGDVALLNCTPSYFSLLIVREDQLIFYRCKSYAVADGEPHPANGMMAREVATSLSYYQDKLAGQGIRTAFVRSVAQPLEELEELLQSLGVERIEPIDPAAVLQLPEGLRLDPEVGQRIAPAVGAAAGRWS